jgi:hypothetical protein
MGLESAGGGLRNMLQSVAQTIAQLVGQNVSAAKYTQTGTTGPGYTSNVNAGQFAFFDTNINGGIASGANTMGLSVAGGTAATLTTSAVTLGTQQALGMACYLDDSATPGNRTVNKARGKNAFAIAAASVVITNSFVTVDSQILCTLEFGDATLTQILRCIPAGGSFTVTGNANATAATKFSWTVIN